MPAVTDVEKFTLIISGIQTLVLIVTVGAALWQLRFLHNQLKIAQAQVAISQEEVKTLRQEIEGDHDWRRRERSILFSYIHNEHLIEVKREIDVAFGSMPLKTYPLGEIEITRINEDPNLRVKVNFLLAWLENIALAVRYKVADFDIIRDLMGDIYVHYFEMFEQYIKDGQRRTPNLWIETQNLASDLQRRGKIVPPSKSPTG